MTVILDYGMGNLASVEKAVRYLGFPCEIRTEAEGSDRLIIPGVGAFGPAMEHLESQRLAIAEHAAAGRPLLGICLGQQLLLESSEEGPGVLGLGLIPGTVRFLSKEGVKVPHVGWNSLEVNPESHLLGGLEPESQVYFVHSLITEVDPRHVAAWSTHGVRFAAALEQGNVMATQFHPEKSGEVGLQILRNFLTW